LAATYLINFVACWAAALHAEHKPLINWHPQPNLAPQFLQFAILIKVNDVIISRTTTVAPNKIV
jgi:hypothetical protein